MGLIFQVLFFVLSNWREIYSLVKAIADLLKQTESKQIKKEVAAELSAAVQVYAKTKDKRPLEKLLCRLKGTCEIAN